MDTVADLGVDPRVKILRQSNQGKSVALNNALEMARGAFYAVHDADDLAHPARLQRQFEELTIRPHLAACFVGHDLLMGSRRIAPRFRWKSEDECRLDIEQMRMPAHDPTAMYRLSLVGDLRYEPSLRIGQGMDYILRVGERHPMMVIGECLYSYRVHGGSVTRQNYRRRQEFVREVKRRACARRGVTGPAAESALPRRRRVRNSDLDNNLVAHFMESALDLRRAGRRWQALRTGLRALSLHPLDPAYLKPAVYALAPVLWIEVWRARRARTARPISAR
jgi:glycosyltransferase involved in cell wall biosynthesis